MPVGRFMIFDSLGGFLWVVTVTSLGLIFSDQLEQIAVRALSWGGWAGRSPGRKFGSLCSVGVYLAPTLPSSAADCAHHSERTHGQTHGRRKHFNRGPAPAHGYRGVSSDDPGRASYSHGRDRRAPRRDSPGSRRRFLLLVTQRSHQRPGGAAAASQRNHQGSPARRRDRRVARVQFPIRYRRPRQETRCPLRKGIFAAAWCRQKSAMSKYKT